MVLAIHELAAPGKDLLDHADQLSQYLRKQQREDGSLIAWEGDETKKTALNETEIAYAGIALHASSAATGKRPAEWKIDLLQKGKRFFTINHPGKPTSTWPRP